MQNTNIHWENLNFAYTPTDYNIRISYKNHEWGEIQISQEETIPIHMAATALHYGQQAFEGLKAFRCPDGKVRVFRSSDNAKRLQQSAAALHMAAPTVETFNNMVEMAVKLNQRWIPPYESQAALYIRPLLLGTQARLGVGASEEYLFIIFVTPVGPYYKAGFKAVDLLLSREYDRAAPKGTGAYKVGGNYAASLRANHQAHIKGYAGECYLDAKEQKYIDECGAANFIAIKNNTYVTPQSQSILPSITNQSLMQIAKDMGMTIEQRQIALSELNQFQEAGACGTAAIITPIKNIHDEQTGINYTFPQAPGPKLTALYNQLRNIQYGIIQDKYQWTNVIDLNTTKKIHNI